MKQRLSSSKFCKTCYRISLFLMLVLYQTVAFSQVKLTGKIETFQKQPVEFAEIILFQKDSFPVESGLADETGRFAIYVDTGNYKVQIRQVGKVLFTKNINIKGDFDLGVIKVDNTLLLGEVVISSSKKLIEKRSGMLIYNVQNSALSSGISAIELLKNIPMIDPTSESLKIIGKSNVQVMINGRLLHLSGNDLNNYLNSLRSENIAKVEVITNPSAKYDASGNSGLINILLKKNSILGFDGSSTSSFVQRTKPGINQSVMLNFSNKRLIVGYNLFLDGNTRYQDINSEYIFSNETRKAFDSSRNNNKGIENNLNLNYKISKRSDLGLSMNLSNWNDHNNYLSNVSFINLDDSIYKRQILPTQGFNKYYNFITTLYYDLDLDSLGSKLSINYNFIKNKNNTLSDLFSRTYNASGEIDSISSSNNNFFSDFKATIFNLDLKLPYKIVKIEAGLQYTHFETNNNVQYYNTSSGVALIDTSLSNQFLYQEKIIAGYVNLSKNFGKKLYVSAGLRYENTLNKENSITSSQFFENHYGNFFPSLSVSFVPNNSNSYSLSYNKRIDRPTIMEVNPFRVYTNALNYSVGNPNLLPSIIHNISIGYVFKGNFSLDLFFSRTLNNSDNVTTTEFDNTIIITKPYNYLTTNDFGTDIAYNWKVNKFINSYNSFYITYEKSYSSLNQVPDSNLKGLTASISSNNTVSLNKKKGHKLFVNCYYAFPGVENIYRSKSIFMFKLGVSLAFLDKKLTVNSSVMDIFNTTVARNTVDFQGFQFKNRIFNDNRSFIVSIHYKFGNHKSKSISSHVNNSQIINRLPSNK